ncbi:hypothetical protein WME73_46060 [Sorangium sp. So ce302]|uniref:hypothetical protein n=1 Tax=Sorangium sp. So ce302 TaxID=3133297 RepID=UPI003F638E3E
MRELGGEIWAEISRRIPDDELDWQRKNKMVDLIMGVLARHIGNTIENDPDLPVFPSPVDADGDSPM